jgi:hypothetical protein
VSDLHSVLWQGGNVPWWWWKHSGGVLARQTGIGQGYLETVGVYDEVVRRYNHVLTCLGM